MSLKNRLLRVRLSAPYVPNWRRRSARGLSLRQSRSARRAEFTTLALSNNRTVADYAGKLYAAVAT